MTDTYVLVQYMESNKILMVVFLTHPIIIIKGILFKMSTMLHVYDVQVYSAQSWYREN